MGAAVAQNVLVSVKNFSGALNEEVISLLNLLLGMKHGSSTTSWKQRVCCHNFLSSKPGICRDGYAQSFLELEMLIFFLALQ